MTRRVRLPTSFQGLFFKLMLAFTILVLTMGVLIIWLAGQATRQEFRIYSTTAGRLQAERLAPLLADHYRVYGNWGNVADVLNPTPRGAMMGHHGGMDMQPNSDMWQMMGMQVLVADMAGTIVGDSSGQLVGQQVDSTSLSAGAPIWVGDNQVGTVWVATAQSAGTENESFLRQVNRAILLAALLAAVVALILGGLLTWNVTRPLGQLTKAAEAIAHGDLSQRVDIHQQDQIGELANAFDQMAAQLERAETLRRQMTADIAHELRTPLAVIQGNIEALQDGVFPLNPEALEPIHAKTRLLGRLVEDLRELALAEAGQLPLDREPTDLGSLVGRTVEVFRATAEAKSIQLIFSPPASLPPADVDPQRIEQVLVNLISNALRHAPLGGEVDVRIDPPDDSSLRVTVTDNGPGIAPAEQPFIFERFYRVDKSRVRQGDQTGSGLGLAVARSIIMAHQGAIGVESPPDRGARFWFTVPVA